MNKEMNPEVKVGDRIVSIHMDGENKNVPIGTEGTVVGVSETPFGKNIQVNWDNGSKLDLLDDVDVWVLSDTESIQETQHKKMTLMLERVESELEQELSMIMPNVAPIPKTKKQSAIVVSKIIEKDFGKSFVPFESIDLESKLIRPIDKIRFFEYYKTFLSEKESRGFGFEGMIAGLYGGDVIEGKNKEDVKFPDGKFYSIKLVGNDEERYDTGSVREGFEAVRSIMDSHEVNITPFKVPADLFESDDENLLKYKRLTLDISFVPASSRGNINALGWIFAIANPNFEIEGYILTNQQVKELLMNPTNVLRGKTQNSLGLRNSSIRSVGEQFIIKFPQMNESELKKFRYVSDRGLQTDKIAELFGEYKQKIRHDVLDYISKNPDKFLGKVIDLYRDRVMDLLLKKGELEDVESGVNEQTIKYKFLEKK